MAKTRKGSTVFDLGAGASDSIQRATKDVDRSHVTTFGARNTYEVSPGVTTKDISPQAQLRCPTEVRDTIRWHALQMHVSMNQLILEILMDAAEEEEWEEPPAEFINDASLCSRRGGRWDSDVYGYNTKDLDCNMPIRMPEDLHLKMKWRSLNIHKSIVEIIFTIVMKRIHDEGWEEAPEWCRKKKTQEQ